MDSVIKRKSTKALAIKDTFQTKLCRLFLCVNVAKKQQQKIVTFGQHSGYAVLFMEYCRVTFLSLQGCDPPHMNIHTVCTAIVFILLNSAFSRHIPFYSKLPLISQNPVLRLKDF